jgi:GTP-binding protein
LIHLIDFSAENSTDPLDNYRIVQSELERFNINLSQRPQILVASKVDYPEAKEKFEEYESRLRELNPLVYAISSTTGEGVSGLLWKTKEMLDQLKEEEQNSTD